MPDEKTDAPADITFHYIKNPNFRAIHVDGAIGGITPSNNIHISLYSERPAIPQKITHQINPDGTLGDVLNKAGRDGIVREMDIDVILDISTARSLSQWLDEQIHTLEEILQNKEV